MNTITGAMTALCLLALVLPLASGCITVTKAPPSSQPVQTRLASAVKKAVLASMVITDDQKSTARQIIQGATIARDQALDLGTDVSDLRLFVAKLINDRVPARYRLRGLALSELVIEGIKEDLGIDVSVDVIPSALVPRARDLVIAAADAAIAAAQPYAG